MLIINILGASSVYANDFTIQNIGTALQVIVPAYAAGMAMQEEGWQGVLEFSGSFAGTMATVEILKETTHETRPNGADDKSFPSGHAAAAFSGATFIHARYGWKRALVPYAAATFVAYSRVQSGWHYTHDVVASAIIAAAWSFLITTKYKPPITVSADTSGFMVSGRVQF